MAQGWYGQAAEGLASGVGGGGVRHVSAVGGDGVGGGGGSGTGGDVGFDGGVGGSGDVGVGSGSGGGSAGSLVAQGELGHPSVAAAIGNARSLVAAANAGTSKQTRDLLGRYASSRPQAALADPMAKPCDDADALGMQMCGTYVFLFASGSERAPKLDVQVGMVHGLLAASPLSRLTEGDQPKASKVVLRYYNSVPVADRTAMYDCHPGYSMRPHRGATVHPLVSS